VFDGVIVGQHFDSHFCDFGVVFCVQECGQRSLSQLAPSLVIAHAAILLFEVEDFKLR
jgi:hypothetical protein